MEYNGYDYLDEIRKTLSSLSKENSELKFKLMRKEARIIELEGKTKQAKIPGMIKGMSKEFFLNMTTNAQYGYIRTLHEIIEYQKTEIMELANSVTRLHRLCILLGAPVYQELTEGKHEDL